jgi:hypothetical protein
VEIILFSGQMELSYTTRFLPQLISIYLGELGLEMEAAPSNSEDKQPV